MKSYIKFFLTIAIISFIFSANTFALETEDVKECKIQTNAHCGNCKTKIENGLKKIDGIIKADVNMDNKVATVSYNSTSTNEEAITKTIADLGYKADAAKDADCSTHKEDCSKKCSDKKDCSSKKASKEGCCSEKEKSSKGTDK